MIRTAALAAALLCTLAPTPGLAWGNMGHRMAGAAAMQALPVETPDFLRTAQAAQDVGELSREQDRSKGAGKVHDQNRDPGHFIDLDEAGRVLGGPPLLPLPATRADYEKGLQSAGLDSWKGGYLPYSIIDQHQQLVKDFGHWRVLTLAVRREADPGRRAWLARDLERRQGQVLQTIGHLSHFVADGAQPLHVSVHFNGWGDYPNPKGYTTARIHGPFEADFVFANVRPQMIGERMAPFQDCGCPLDQRVTAYLTGSLAQVEPLYALEKAGGFATPDSRGIDFAADRLAVGASELRDLIVLAWRASADAQVGWPAAKVADVVAGRVDPYDALYGKD